MAELPHEVEDVPLRLYYSLLEGHTADAEVVARASLAFIAGVKELTYVLDPSLKIQIGIQGYSDGSLWEDLLIIVDKAKVEYNRRSKRYNLAIAALAWIMAPPLERGREIIWQPILDKYLPNATEEDIAEAKRLIEIAESGKIATQQKQQFYRELGRDTGISGFSANIDRGRPVWNVPKEEFPSYSGASSITESSLDRTTTGEMRIIILSPVLDISNRRWKFATAQGEFGAAVKDKAFLEQIVAGQTRVHMRGGVELDVVLETKERLVDGVWTVIERNVLRVTGISEPGSGYQSSMFPYDSD